MSEAEGFLGRWSRLKREAATDGAREEDPSGPESPSAADQPAAGAEPAVDLEALPPIESLTAESDYKPFLAQGVPEELRRLALRKAWTTNPQIANFRGFADYDWDCNAPGYGQLLPIDDIKRLCDAVLRPAKEEKEDAVEAPAADAEPGPAVPRVEHDPTAAPAAPADPPVVAGSLRPEESVNS
jgi:Protein of unknown function (DUF3306)